MSDILIQNEVDLDPTTGEPWVAHIVKKDEVMDGYVNGKSIEALCGKKIVPSRDPNNKPICKACKDIFRQLANRGSN